VPQGTPDAVMAQTGTGKKERSDECCIISTLCTFHHLQFKKIPFIFNENSTKKIPSYRQVNMVLHQGKRKINLFI
jgi:hypothetical protein